MVARNVKVVAESVLEGVPEITQVLAFTLKPEGNAVVPDLIPQAVIAAPLAARVVGEMLIAWPTVPLVPLAPE